MAEVLIGLFTVILVLISIFVVLVVLMQRASSNAGMGSALGGGAAESAFGGETGNVLTKATIYGVAAFFVIALGLYLGQMALTYDDRLETEAYRETTIGAGDEEASPEADGAADAEQTVSPEARLPDPDFQLPEPDAGAGAPAEPQEPANSADEAAGENPDEASGTAPGNTGS